MNKNSLSKCRAILFLFLACSFIANSFVDVVSDFLIIFGALIAFILSFPNMSRMPKIMVVILLVLSHLIYFQSGRSYEYWSQTTIESLIYICLFVSAPLLSIPIRGGGYIEYFEQLADRYLKKTNVLLYDDRRIICATRSLHDNWCFIYCQRFI